MPAYLVIDLDIHDTTGFDNYARAVAPVLAKYGGRYLVRRRAVDVLEGEWHPKRVTIIEFPTRARATEFYNSSEFREIVGLRLRSATTNLVLVEEPRSDAQIDSPREGGIAMTIVASTVDAVRGLACAIRDHADRIEQERCLPKPVVRGLIDAGVFRMLVPRSLGGGEVDPITACRVVEEASIQDGSVGWCAMIGACNSHFGGLLPTAGAREIYADRDAVLAGTFRPNGVAVAVDGGYRITGRWPFASGIMHASWLIGGCRVQDGNTPRLTASGAPALKLMFLPRAEATVLDTWYTGGLRGTGSHDFEVRDVFVPSHRSMWFADPPVERGPLYSLPPIAFFATLIASVSLGIARHALKAFKELAGSKKPTHSPDLLRASPVAQFQLGQAEGLLRAGRAFLLEAIHQAWAVAQRGELLSWYQRGLLWLAATQAAAQALQAVDIVYRAGGASSVYASMQLERCLRDIRTASQHLCVVPTNYEVAGQLFLGIEPSATPWNRDDRGDVS